MSEIKFKKYKNRKIYNTETSKYATLPEVYLAAMNGSITVTDVSTGKDITDETIIRGAIEVLGTEGLQSLSHAAIEVGHDSDLTKFCAQDSAKTSIVKLKDQLDAQRVKVLTPRELSEVKGSIEDLFQPISPRSTI